jgi:predicted Zn-dependent protease
MAAGRLLSLLAAAALGVACVQHDGSRNPLRSITHVDVEDERERGALADAQIQTVLPLVDDPVVLGFVNDLGQAIVAKIEPQPFIYRFRVVVDPQLNAFALPGGYIYFHSGTLLQAASIDELAGVMAHEIGHVKGRHYARMVEQAAIPDLLAKVAGLAATLATGEAAPLLVSEGLNVALQLRFSREFEAEADDLGATFMARSGYDPRGMVRFFERIVAAEQAAVDTRLAIPPYLYTHPDVASRIDVARRRAEKLSLTGTADPEVAAGMRAAQYRLALLVDSGQTTLRQASAPAHRAATDPLLVEAQRLAGAGDRLRALAVLEQAEQADPNDPRIAFRRGELLAELDRPREAIAAWRRALLLDPGVALNYFRIGLAYKALGDRVNATFYLEQALRRFEPGGALQRRAAREIDRLTFPVITSAGLADGSSEPGADTVAGHSREEFRGDDPRAVWWARVGSRYLGRRGDIVVRWLDPGGAVVQEEAVDPRRRPHVISTLALGDGAAPGIWRVEALLDGDLVDRRTFRLAP